MSFGERLTRAFDRFGHLCVGIDPHEHLLEGWGLDASASGAREFGLRVVEAAAGRVGIVKPQVSFFERYGSAGFAALEGVLSAAREAGLIVIADAKRGDIGTTMDAYARAWLTPGSPLEADAVTVTPYLGVGSLADTFRYAVENGKGVFVLAATSNPEGSNMQRATVASADPDAAPPRTLAHHVIDEVSRWNRAATGPDRLADVGFVIGATVDRAEYALPDRMRPPAPILAPGFGAQGARLADLDALFGPLAPTVIASESRSILSSGPGGIVAAIDAKVAELGGARG